MDAQTPILRQADIVAELQHRLEPAGRPSSVKGFIEQLARVTAADGFSVSLQASRFHYCTPRNNEGPWTHVELGYPDQRAPSLLKYAEDRKQPTSTVYGYVPLIAVARVIARHGGLLPRPTRMRTTA